MKVSVVKQNRQKYIPALSYRWLTPLYDPLLRWTMRDVTFKHRLMEQARIEKGQRVLDLGCGTATLTILIKQEYPEARVVGLDGDPKVIEIARAKAARAGLSIDFDSGMAFQLPYEDSSFDCILSSLLFHHLNREDKRRTLKEVLRVLRPGGELHVADLGRPSNPAMYLISLIVRRLEETADNIRGRLPEMLKEAGLEQVRESARFMTIFGTLSFYRARKPEGRDATNIA